MTTIINPSLELTANGAVALLDTVNQGFKVYELPALTLQTEQDSYENVFGVILSSSGTAVAVRTMTDELEVITSSKRQSYQLPWQREQIRALAVADAGNQVALLVVATTAAVGASSNGRLEIWSLPPADEPLASVPLPLYDYAALTANDDLSTLTVYTATNLGNNQFSGVYIFTSADGQLTPLWTESGAELTHIHVTPYADWVWAVQADGLTGWHGSDPPVTLPGTLREQLIFSPTGNHLLVYQVMEVTDMTTASILFRLFDLSSQQEIKRTTEVVEQYNMAHFALSEDLALFAVRVTAAGHITLSELAWAD
jgi:hypothetical protein